VFCRRFINKLKIKHPCFLAITFYRQKNALYRFLQKIAFRPFRKFLTLAMPLFATKQQICAMNREPYQLDFILLNIGHAVHHGDWNWKDINSPFTRIHLVTKGTATIIRDDGTIVLQENHLYLTSAYTRHSYQCDGEFSLYYMHIYENPEKKTSIFDALQFPIAIESDDLILQLVQRLIEINPGRELSYYDPKSYDHASGLIKNLALQIKTPIAFEVESQGIIKQLLSRFLAHATKKKPHVDERLLKVLDYIHAHIHTSISIDTLAELSFLTKDHFIRLFKKQLNSTPGKYINQKKIEKAQLLMLLENPSIQELAYKLGFENVSYFNRLFKKMTGENPSTHKKRLAAFNK